LLIVIEHFLKTEIPAKYVCCNVAVKEHSSLNDCDLHICFGSVQCKIKREAYKEDVDRK